MLGGSFWIAFLRNGLSAGLMIAVFMLLEHPLASREKLVRGSILFWMLATAGYSAWYWLDTEGFVRFAGLSAILVVGVYGLWIGRDSLYLSLYKLALGFYLLSVTVFCGIDLSRLWFGGSIWADILVRVVLVAAIVFLLVTKIRKSFLEGAEYLREEMDMFSAVALLMSVLIASMVAFWPGSHDFSILHIGRIAILLFMTGLIQYMVFHLYLHRGKERRYRTEHELIRMNGQIVRHQMELIHQAMEEEDKFSRHCFRMEELIRCGDWDGLVIYAKQYREDTQSSRGKRLCENEELNRLLSTYGSLAEKEHIRVDMYVGATGDLAVRDIDLAAVLVYTFENAIRGCIESRSPMPRIHLSVIRKGKKLAILCRNTCAADMKLRDGLPEPGIDGGAGILGVMKVVSFYHGEADFTVEHGMFTARILLNLADRLQSVCK